MANEVLIKNGTSIIVADTTDHNPTAGVSLGGTRTDQIDLTSLANGAWRTSAKFDFTTPRGARFDVRAAIEWSTAPTVGSSIDFFIGYSDSSTAANNNPGNLNGTDSGYVGYGTTNQHGTDASKQFDYVGSLVATNDADTQVAHIGVIEPRQQHGILVIFNDSGQALIADAVEMSIHLVEIIDEVQ